MRKKKIFLAGYINSINAQNLNCLSLAKHLDKSKFDIFTFEIYSGNLPSNTIPGVKIFTCFYPHRVSKYIAYLWGILKCDIAFLPKGELVAWCKFWITLLGKKSFSSIEVALHCQSIKKPYYASCNKVFAISNFIKNSSERYNNFSIEKRVLFLGVEYSRFFIHRENSLEKLENIAFVGSLTRRKRLVDVFELAKNFPNINFHIFGTGQDKHEEKDIISEGSKYKNVIFYGVLTHDELSVQLKKCQLHVFPSRVEGFPKVILETAAAGIPSIVYSDYGASEWINHGVNGFVVNTLEEIINLVAHYQEKPHELSKISKNAQQLAEKFDWANIVKDWEEKILEM